MYQEANQWPKGNIWALDELDLRAAYWNPEPDLQFSMLKHSV